MQNKTKLFLLPLMLLGLSFFFVEKVQAVDCVCGSSAGKSFLTAPTGNLCSTGSVVDMQDDGTGNWDWGCYDPCDMKPCTAIKQNEVTACICGSSNGQTLDTAPTSNLCSTGTASAVTGAGPWTWSCGETCGTATCSANKTGNVTSGPTYPEDTGLPTNPDLVKGIFTNVANFLLSIIGIIAIISFIISGIQYFMVAADEEMLKKAKKTMLFSIVGLVVALFGYIAIKTVEMLLQG